MDLQIVATVCMFLASKADETPCGLDRIVVVAYETMHKRDPTAAESSPESIANFYCTRKSDNPCYLSTYVSLSLLNHQDFFEKQKALILIGERLLLSTLRFDFNIQHPYRPLLNALKKLGITQKEVRQVAWNYVNDWLWTTLCLQYKPHYIAAGSLFLATKLHNVRLPSEEGGYVWWHEFDINPQQLEVVIQQMKQLLGFNRRTSVIQPSIATNKDVYSSPDSVLIRPESSRSSSIQEPDVDITTHKPVDATDHDLTNISIAEKEKSSTEYRTEQRQTRVSENPIAVAEHNETLGRNVDRAVSRPNHTRVGFGKVDMDRIKATIKKRKKEIQLKKLDANVDFSEDAWIERELEVGMELEAESAKKQKLLGP
ncbi:Cyclin, N-terminal domain [Musa troglodytarum]|uniref:Cyclin, N-terminal domain n=1 Tax=Musa troglodytarum TaxID=320322 RepID=A0A9E7GZM9_9LILI|nr:Cyclin, N-terminal domain [Musa troglodytarum]